MSYLEKLKKYLGMQALKTSLYLNPQTFNMYEIHKKENKFEVKEELPKNTMPVYVYQKYQRVQKKEEVKRKIFLGGDYIYLSSEMHTKKKEEEPWQLVSMFYSRNVYEPYETEKEKLIIVPVECITQEQYEMLNQKRGIGYKNGKR